MHSTNRVHILIQSESASYTLLENLMASITCSKSSIVFNCEHLPISLTSREISHPFFSIPKKRLISLAGQWSAGKLSHTENYLLYLSLLDSTDLLVWRAPAIYHDKTAQIVANNMESLIHIIGKIDLINHPSFQLPKFSIGPDTSSLSNSHHWIQTWIIQYNEWYDSFKSAREREMLKEQLDTREASLQRLIKTAHTTPDDLANSLASWAEIAGDFPHTSTPHPITGRPITISEYWKQLIRACAKSESIFKYPKKDIEELIEHLEDSLELGSINSSAIFSLLRRGLERQRDYLGFGEVDLAGRKTSFVLLGHNASAEDSNIAAAIASAPEHEPIANNYPNRFAYMKAKANWDMKQRYSRNGV